jgi:hypothetical protein
MVVNSTEDCRIRARRFVWELDVCDTIFLTSELDLGFFRVDCADLVESLRSKDEGDNEGQRRMYERRGKKKEKREKERLIISLMIRLLDATVKGKCLKPR